MKIVILLSLSGSVALAAGTIFVKSTDRYSSIRWQDMWAKMTLAFYLVSGLAVAGVKYVMKKLHILERTEEKNYIFLSHKIPYILKNEVGLRVNLAFILYAVVTSVMVLIMLGLLVKKLSEYKNIRRGIMQGIVFKREEVPDEELERLKGMIRLKKKVQVYLTDLPMGAFTIGYFRPVIVLQDGEAPEKREVILLHELCHIKRRDTLFKLVANAVVCVHWFNPLVYTLPGMVNRVCELNCDEMVLLHLSPKQKEIYIQEIVSQSKRMQGKGNMSARFGGNMNLTLERVKNMRNENRKKRGIVSKCLMAVLTVIMLVVSSLPVCAYEGVRTLQLAGDGKSSTEETWNVWGSDRLFTEDDSFSFETEDVMIKFDRQFIDENGNIYDVDLNENRRVGCSHSTLVSGTYQTHDKNSSGGCVVKIYAAKRCSNCGSVFQGDLISKTEYTKCPH